MSTPTFAVGDPVEFNQGASRATGRIVRFHTAKGSSIDGPVTLGDDARAVVKSADNDREYVRSLFVIDHPPNTPKPGGHHG